eukprot:729457-Amphidinium_carterae.1
MAEISRMGLTSVLASRLYHMSSLALAATFQEGVGAERMHGPRCTPWKASPKEQSRLTEVKYQMLKEREKRRGRTTLRRVSSEPLQTTRKRRRRKKREATRQRAATSL